MTSTSTSTSTRRFRFSISGPARLLLTLAYGIPILWIVLTSLKDPADVLAGDSLLVFQPTLNAYVSALSDSRLYEAALQTLLIATGTTVLTMVVAVPAAYALARWNGALVTALLGALIVLQIMPQTSMVIPLYQVFGQWRILDQSIAVILADSALLTPFAIILLRPFFRAVPLAIEEAAAIDGAGAFRTFRSVALPISANGLATTATLVFLMSWGEFLYAVNFFLTPSKYPLSALLAQQVSAYGINWPGLMALAVITSVPILVLFIFTYRFLKEGLTIGAVK